jgi:hypothetical protein
MYSGEAIQVTFLILMVISGRWLGILIFGPAQRMNKYSRLPFWFKEQDKPEATIRIVEGIYKKAQLIQEFPEID